MTARIFLSYRRADSAGQAGRLHDDLAALFADEDIFLDVSDLQPGLPFPAEIGRAINACEVLLVVIGPRWLDDAGGGRRIDQPEDWVRREIHQALELRKLVMPVLVGGARMPGPAGLPPEIARFADHGAIEVSDARWSYDVGLLLKALAELRIVPPARTAFLGQSCGRVEVRMAWLCALDPDAARQELEAFAGATGVTLQAASPGTTTIRGGSRWRTRILGMPLTKPEAWPYKGMLRLAERGARLQVEALLCEDWGTGVLDPVNAGRYRQRLESIIAGLREATGG